MSKYILIVKPINERDQTELFKFDTVENLIKEIKEVYNDENDYYEGIGSFSEYVNKYMEIYKGEKQFIHDLLDEV
jgi:nucleoid-associated protein YejK